MGPLALGFASPKLSSPSHIHPPRVRALELQPPSASAHLSQAPPGDEGPSGAGGLLGAPPQHLSLGTTMPDGAGRAWSVEPEGSRDAAGTRTPAQQCQACHHQRLLLFPAHFLTDSKVKSKTCTRPWAASRKRNTCGGSMPPIPPGSLLAGHPFHRHSQGRHVPSASQRCVSCRAALHSHGSAWHLTGRPTHESQSWCF